MNSGEQKKSSIMEKYAGETINKLILSGIVGLCALVYTLNQNISAVSTNVAVVKSQIEDMKSAQSSYLTRAEADQRGKTRDAQIESLKSDFNSVKTDVQDLKKKVFKQ